MGSPSHRLWPVWVDLGAASVTDESGSQIRCTWAVCTWAVCTWAVDLLAGEGALFIRFRLE